MYNMPGKAEVKKKSLGPPIASLKLAKSLSRPGALFTLGGLMRTLILTLVLVGVLTSAYAYKLSPHFDYKEFSCKCCGETKINIELIIALEKLRNLVNSPIIITSGYRCPKHNQEVGGVDRSQHTFGNAVDIKIKGYTPSQVSKLAKQCGFTWTKVYSTWTHIDVRGEQ